MPQCAPIGLVVVLEEYVVKAKAGVMGGHRSQVLDGEGVLIERLDDFGLACQHVAAEHGQASLFL
eukprot:CAMPEP_0170174216 /NCGR_PEP_ID=MMETSP0040_2-20121228/7460_1 /TAXON_ID=641309 /ORGANISM="Lotharella oceanica, Strain CCMP622" /LENGTH=64 /DNA_ID=CAMNT_0010415755 /DNA_START=532 /DNA_END=726 /DNA_ORIENTATION=-